MFYHNHDLKLAHVGIFYRNFKKISTAYCHVGLGVNALNLTRVLRRAGVRTDIFPVREEADLEEILKKTPSLTHVIIEAPWVSTNKIASWLNDFPSMHFIVRSHSQIGFLQVEPGAIKLLREQLLLQDGSVNFNIASNTRKLTRFIHEVYGSQCLYLPNLYDMVRSSLKRDVSHNHKLLRIGSFGALRLMKNHTTACAAAMHIASNIGCDLEFYVSVNREEHGKGVLQSLRNMMDGLKWAKLVEVGWEEWAQFKNTIRHMDLCMQVSMSETFNIVTADATAVGVPSVVSEAVEWAPKSWYAEIDDEDDIAKVGQYLLMSHSEAAQGLQALKDYNDESLRIWLKYLSSNPTQPMYTHIGSH